MNEIQQQIYNFIAPKITDPEDLDQAQEMIKEFSVFQAQIFLNIKFSDSDTELEYMETLQNLEFFLEDHYSYIVDRIEKEALQNRLVINSICRMIQWHRDLFTILDDTKLSESQLSEISSLSDYNAEIIKIAQKTGIIMSFEDFKKMPQLTDNQAAAFTYLHQKEKTLENVKRIPQLTYNQAAAFTQLHEKEQTLENVKKIAELTNNQAAAFAQLHQEEKTLENVKRIPQLTNNQADTFISLPKNDQTFESLKQISDLTDKQALTFSSLSKKYQTLDMLKRITKYNDFQLLAMCQSSCMEDTTETMSQSSFMEDITETQRLIGLLCSNLIIQFPNEAKEVIDHSFALIQSFKTHQTKIFLSIDFSNTTTLTILYDIICIVSKFDEQQYQLHIDNAPTEEQALIRLQKSLFSTYQWHNLVFKTLDKIYVDKNYVDLVMQTIQDLSMHKTIALMRFSPEDTKFLSVLESISKLTDVHAKAFNSLTRAEKISGHTQEAFNAFESISKLTNLQALSFMCLPENQRKFGALKAISKLTNYQALNFISLLEKDQTYDESSLMPKIISIFTSANSPNKLDAILKLTEDQAKANIRALGPNEILHRLSQRENGHASQNLPQQKETYEKHIVFSDIITQASLNSALKKVLPDTNYTQVLAPAVAKIATHYTGSFFLTTALDVLRFGAPQNIHQASESALKIITPIVTHQLLSYVNIPVSSLTIYKTLKAISILSAFYSYSHEHDTSNSFYEMITNIVQNNSDPISIGFLAFSATNAIPEVSLLAAIGIASAAGAASYAVSELLLGENSNEVNLETSDL